MRAGAQQDAGIVRLSVEDVADLPVQLDGMRAPAPPSTGRASRTACAYCVTCDLYSSSDPNSDGLVLDESPLGGAQLKPGATASAQELRDYLAPKFAKFWLPDAFAFVAEIPRTSTGKMMKAKLREQFNHWKWT